MQCMAVQEILGRLTRPKLSLGLTPVFRVMQTLQRSNTLAAYRGSSNKYGIKVGPSLKRARSSPLPAWPG
jgi:hypothetical protein